MLGREKKKKRGGNREFEKVEKWRGMERGRRIRARNQDKVAKGKSNTMPHQPNQWNHLHEGGEHLSLALSFFFFLIKCKNCIDQKELETSNTRKREQNPLTKSKARLAC